MHFVFAHVRLKLNYVIDRASPPPFPTPHKRTLDAGRSTWESFRAAPITHISHSSLSMSSQFPGNFHAMPKNKNKKWMARGISQVVWGSGSLPRDNAGILTSVFPCAGMRKARRYNKWAGNWTDLSLGETKG